MGSYGRMILPPSFKRLYEVNPWFLSELLHPKHSNHFICICLGMIASIQLRKLWTPKYSDFQDSDVLVLWHKPKQNCANSEKLLIFQTNIKNRVFLEGVLAKN